MRIPAHNTLIQLCIDAAWAFDAADVEGLPEIAAAAMALQGARGHKPRDLTLMLRIMKLLMEPKPTEKLAALLPRAWNALQVQTKKREKQEAKEAAKNADEDARWRREARAAGVKNDRSKIRK